MAESSPDETGLLVVHGRSGTTWSGRLHRDDRPRPPGAVFGPVTAEQAGQLLNRLRASDDPGRIAQDLPWAAAVVRADGTLALTVSTVLGSGLFWSGRRAPDGWRFVAGTQPLAVARTTGTADGPVEVDDDYLHRFVVGDYSADGTPFTGVRRLPTGVTLVLDPRTGTSRETEWCGPMTLPPPALRGEGVAAVYRDTFDEAVHGLARVAGPLVTTVSGGLDSTFLAASLVAARPDGPVAGYCYRPLPQANARSTGLVDPDDFPLAALMARRHPGVLTVDPLVNDGLIHPLDAAAATFRASGWPEYGTRNTWWGNAVTGLAARAGTGLVFFGTAGNVAFSHEHGYAAAHYLGQGRVAAVAAEFARSPAGAARALRTRFAPAPLRWDGWRNAGLVAPPGSRPGIPLDDRALFLARLTGRLTGLRAAANPARTPGVLIADPYTCRSVIELASAIEPSEWRRGPRPRALARRLGAGRVPDQIRLRTRRGGQNGDSWFVVRNLPGRLRAEVEDVLDDAAFAPVVDRAALHGWLGVALDTPATARPPAALAVVLRLVSAAQYRRWVQEALTGVVKVDVTQGEIKSVHEHVR